jgi:hypothetical protein
MAAVTITTKITEVTNLQDLPTIFREHLLPPTLSTQILILPFLLNLLSPLSGILLQEIQVISLTITFFI